MLTVPLTFGKRNGAFDGSIVALRQTAFDLVVGATDGVDVGGLVGIPLIHASLVCPPKAPLQHSN
jgi:hypothetical protein